MSYDLNSLKRGYIGEYNRGPLRTKGDNKKSLDYYSHVFGMMNTPHFKGLLHAARVEGRVLLWAASEHRELRASRLLAEAGQGLLLLVA